MAFHLRAAVDTLLSCVSMYQCDLGTPEAQPSTAGPDELSAVWASESQPRDRGREEVKETFMALNTELTELLKAGAQFAQFLEPYPQAKEQSLYIRSLLGSQAYRAARLCRASARW